MAQYALAEFNIWPGSQVAGRIRMALVPGLDRNDSGTVGYNHGVGLAASSRDKDAAWAALLHYAGKDQDGSFAMPRARLLAEGGRCPYLAVYGDPEVERMTQQMTGGDLEDYRKLSQIVKQRQAMKAAWYPEWELYMMQQVQEALVRNVSVTDALNAAAREARRLKRV